ncbi:baseplate J/gp47 family protein [Candidatus Pacearchaeota archaeon]|jgi:hypothetical protein|nr:baseplate J/gp47 family protein [Candidatus Pacearchaeota archaeon]
MVRVRTANDIVLSIIDYYRTSQQQLDLKPGQVARDLLVDGPAVQLASLYEELQSVQSAQSLFLSMGSELDALGSNFGVSRKQGTASSGIAVLTFNNIEADIPITKGSIVTASNGASFTVISSMTVAVINKNTYRATASKYSAALSFVGISDQYAVEVNVQATSNGNGGNISAYALNRTTIPGVSHVINAAPFQGGSAAESDSAFKRRIFGVFNGSNTGTATGYKNTVLSDPDVIDVLIVGPGDSLMTRDGTQVHTAEDGTQTIVSEGTGGKVDLYAYGFRLTEIVDGFVYFDHSNKNDPTDSSNDFVLGQIEADTNKTVSRKRIDDINNQTLPNQPATNIISITGSSSGSNFIPKSVDASGVISGNYELLRDTGVYAGSPWGFDRLHWIDDRIRDLVEDITKGKFNSQDSTNYSDVTFISRIKQNIQIVNENSSITPSDRSSIQLSHYPLTSVTRVFNQTTGERYLVTNQNPDGGSINTTGRITISGSTLPAVSDILQVDYIWLFDYDPNWDFDNKITSNNIRSVVNSIDWGYSNEVRREESIVSYELDGYVVLVTHPINAVVSVNSFIEKIGTGIDGDGMVQQYNGRLGVAVDAVVSNVVSVVLNSNGAEIYNTGANDGSFSGSVVFFPTDTTAQIDDIVDVRYNASDLFIKDGINGSFSDNKITLLKSAGVAGEIVEVNYLANITQLVPSVILSQLPIYRNQNGFYFGTGNTFGVQPTTHIYDIPISLIPDPAPPVNMNLRKAPSRLKLTIAGTISPGVITVSGTTISGIFDGVFTATANGLAQDLSPLIRSALGLNSNQSIPNNVSIISLVGFEKVEMSGTEVISVDHVYDVFGYGIRDNIFSKFEATTDTSLSTTQIKLPSTVGNNINSPKIGDKVRVTFYISKTSDIENVSFSKSGNLYTQKIFAFVDVVSVSSGFTSNTSQAATLSIAPQNQPIQGTRYSAYYDYLAPKPNERITIRYNANQVITDNTFAIEQTRSIGADVLVKAAVPILVNLTIAIVVSRGFETSSAVVVQNVKDAITNALNSTALATTVDASDFINVAYTVSGVDRARILAFNKDGVVGQVLSITAQSNQYIQANKVLVQIETR